MGASGGFVEGKGGGAERRTHVLKMIPDVWGHGAGGGASEQVRLSTKAFT